MSLGCVFIAGWGNSNHELSNFTILMFFQEVFNLMYPIGLAVSTFAAFVATPFAVLALKTGTKNLIKFGSAFWVFLALYIFWAPSFHHDGLAIGVGAVLTIAGLLVIGRIPPKGLSR